MRVLRNLQGVAAPSRRSLTGGDESADTEPAPSPDRPEGTEADGEVEDEDDHGGDSARAGETDTDAGTGTDDASETVLVVDDDEGMADTYSAWLNDSYEIITTYSGPEALVELNESVDVVLLDRRMPEMPGDLVLENIRERGLDCEVAMLTAVPARVDIVQMPFDDYLTKPVTKRDVRRTVETLADRPEDIDEESLELLRVASKYRAVVESDIQSPEATQYLERELRQRWESTDIPFSMFEAPDLVKEVVED